MGVANIFYHAHIDVDNFKVLYILLMSFTDAIGRSASYWIIIQGINISFCFDIRFYNFYLDYVKKIILYIRQDKCTYKLHCINCSERPVFRRFNFVTM